MISLISSFINRFIGVFVRSFAIERLKWRNSPFLLPEWKKKDDEASIRMNKTPENPFRNRDYILQNC